jgi:hypothetical protein
LGNSSKANREKAVMIFVVNDKDSTGIFLLTMRQSSSNGLPIQILRSQSAMTMKCRI